MSYGKQMTKFQVKLLSPISFTMKMGATTSFATMVPNYQTTRCRRPKTVMNFPAFIQALRSYSQPNFGLLKSILILSSHLCVGLLRHNPSFSTKLCMHFSVLHAAACPVKLILLDLVTLTILCDENISFSILLIKI
jgi:hypothetical protein